MKVQFASATDASAGHLDLRVPKAPADISEKHIGTLIAELQHRRVGEGVISSEEGEFLSPAAVVMLDELIAAASRAGIRLTLGVPPRQVSPALRSIIEQLRHRGTAGEVLDGPPQAIAQPETRFSMASVFRFLRETLYWTLVEPIAIGNRKFDFVVGHMLSIGVGALPVVSVISFLMGGVLALQGALQLSRYGAGIYVADLVAASMVGVIAPMLTGIMVAGRSGAAIAAELGTMCVNEEIDALRSMGMHPMKYLVAPRMMALAIVMPCLVLLANVAGLLGGLLGAVFLLDIGMLQYLKRTQEALSFWLVVRGLIEALVFSFLVGLVSCFYGMHVSGGAVGVGKATTKSVVVSIFLIIIALAVLTLIFANVPKPF